MATLAFAEVFRLSMNLVRFSIEKDGRATGLNGPEGFENIRWIFENNIDTLGFLHHADNSNYFTILFFHSRAFFHYEECKDSGKDLILAQSLGINPEPYRFFYRHSW